MSEQAPLKTVSLCGVKFVVQSDRVVAQAIDREGWIVFSDEATIPCAKGRLKALLAVIDYAIVEEESAS